MEPGVNRGEMLINGLIWSGKRDLNPRPSPWQGFSVCLDHKRQSEMENRKYPINKVFPAFLV
jgi:hypothetical protein